jgi:hypothetical protein
MYKVDIKTLNEITKMLDECSGNKMLSLKEQMKIEKKAKKLSQKIKDNYTQIKK